MTDTIRRTVLTGSRLRRGRLLKETRSASWPTPACCEFRKGRQSQDLEILPYGLHPKGRPFESDSAHHTFQLPLHTLSVFCPCSPLGFGNLRRVVFLLCSFIPGTSRCTEAGSRATPFQASRIHRTLLPRQPTRSPRGNCMSAEAGSLIPSLGSILHRRSKRESIDGSLSRNPSRFI